jgi:hypothetical protein
MGMKHRLSVCSIGILLLVSAIGFLVFCSKKDSPTGPDGETAPAVETASMKTLSDSLVVAFQSGNADRVLGYMNDEFKGVYRAELAGSTADMAALGEALKGRRLVSANGLYAEYQISVGGETYTLAYSNTGDGPWQLVRF